MHYTLLRDSELVKLKPQWPGSVFIVKTPSKKIKQIYVNESIDEVREKMKLCYMGDRKYVYLHHDEDDIEMEYFGGNVWQLMDSYDLYQFSCTYNNFMGNYTTKKKHN